MKPPSPAWEADYEHGRRKHRHRCCCCNRIITAGEHVIMNRVKRNQTRAVHIDCADKIAINNKSWRWLMAAQGAAYLRACGWKIPEMSDFSRQEIDKPENSKSQQNPDK